MDRMILRDMQNTSAAILVLRVLLGYLDRTALWATNLYYGSQICRLLNAVMICFRHSFLGRVSERGGLNRPFREYSRIICFLKNLYVNFRPKITCFLQDSIVGRLARDIREGLLIIRVFGLAIITVILTNVTLLIVLQREINPWGIFMRLLFLFWAGACFFCRVDWQILRRSSILFGDTKNVRDLR